MNIQIKEAIKLNGNLHEDLWFMIMYYLNQIQKKQFIRKINIQIL